MKTRRAELLEEQTTLLAEARRTKKQIQQELNDINYAISRFTENIRDIKAGKYD